MTEFTPEQLQIISDTYILADHPNKAIILEMVMLAQERFPLLPLKVILEIFSYAKQAYDS
jgi:hypothetical protein